MTRLIVIKTDDGDRTFPTKDLDFYNLVCELEASGVDVMGLTSGSLDGGKIFTTMRALLAVLINVSTTEAGKLIGQHIKNGGALDEIMEAFTEAMEDAGFGAQEQTVTTEAPKKTAKGRKPKNA